jgi:hypothetical protein
LAFSQTLWLMIVKLMVKLNDFEKTWIFWDFFLIWNDPTLTLKRWSTQLHMIV